VRVSIITNKCTLFDFYAFAKPSDGSKKKTRHLTEHVTSKEQLDFKMIPSKNRDGRDFLFADLGTVCVCFIMTCLFFKLL